MPRSRTAFPTSASAPSSRARARLSSSSAARASVVAALQRRDSLVVDHDLQALSSPSSRNIVAACSYNASDLSRSPASSAITPSWRSDQASPSVVFGPAVCSERLLAQAPRRAPDPAAATRTSPRHSRLAPAARAASRLPAAPPRRTSVHPRGDGRDASRTPLRPNTSRTTDSRSSRATKLCQGGAEVVVVALEQEPVHVALAPVGLDLLGDREEVLRVPAPDLLRLAARLRGARGRRRGSSPAS